MKTTHLVRVPITLSEEECRREWFMPGGRQCASIYVSRSGAGAFCIRRHGHEGDHRGYRTQWREEAST